jgi:hypothetical protein
MLNLSANQGQTFDEVLQLRDDPAMSSAIGARHTDEASQTVGAIVCDPALGGSQRQVVLARHLREGNAIFQGRPQLLVARERLRTFQLGQRGYSAAGAAHKPSGEHVTKQIRKLSRWRAILWAAATERKLATASGWEWRNQASRLSAGGSAWTAIHMYLSERVFVAIQACWKRCWKPIIPHLLYGRAMPCNESDTGLAVDTPYNPAESPSVNSALYTHFPGVRHRFIWVCTS